MSIFRNRYSKFSEQNLASIDSIPATNQTGSVLTSVLDGVACVPEEKSGVVYQVLAVVDLYTSER